MINHVIWDFDGTLFDTYSVMANVCHQLLASYGYNEPVESIMAHMKVSMGYAIEQYRLRYGIDDVFVKKYNELRKAEEVRNCKPFEGIENICKTIVRHGKSNYLYTHRGESSIDLLKKFGLHDLFCDFITAENHFERKPSPEAIQYLLRKHKIQKEHAIMIGDREIDILAGKNAGILTCLFDSAGQSNIHADFSICCIDELYDTIGIEGSFSRG